MGTVNTLNRGALIVLEGCDRCGKSTQSKKMVEYLNSIGVTAKYMNFPARETISGIGNVIDSYLKKKVELSDKSIHLIFSANRWELQNNMKELLESGTTLIVDRYSYSGIAYSAAKGLSYEWCKGPEKGLIRPDLVFYLATDADVIAKRENFGDERYEKQEFQQKVKKNFEKIYIEEKDYWKHVNADENIDVLHKNLRTEILDCLNNVKTKPLEILWEI